MTFLAKQTEFDGSEVREFTAGMRRNLLLRLLTINSYISAIAISHVLRSP